MEELQVDVITFFGVVEFALILMVIAVVFVVRSKNLAHRMRVLERELKQAADIPDPVSFSQYLRDEVLRNQGLIDNAAASGDDAGKQVAELLKMRKRFLEMEVEARELEKNPVAFQEKLAAGITELVEQLRPEPETVTEVVETAAADAAEEDAEQDAAEAASARELIDTHDDEVDHLKQVINNQQDAMEALRAKLKEHEGELQDVDGILRKLDEFEKQSKELHACLKVLEQENERLKTARQEGRDNGRVLPPTEPAQLTGLKSMVGKQQETIANLQNLIRELAPEASKAKELEDAINGMQRANQELNGCVAVLEDENAMLRGELEEIQQQLEQQEQAAAAAEEAASADELLQDEEGEAGLSAEEEKEQLEIKVQELEALIEFKDAAIEELEKQYNALESKYMAATGQK